MLDKLESLSLETLLKLKENVQAAITRKQRQVLRPGTEATFYSEKRGRNVRILIEKINPKSIGGYEIDAHGNHLRSAKWRVHPSLLTPVLTKPAVAPVAKLGAGADRPTGSPAW